MKNRKVVEHNRSAGKYESLAMLVFGAPEKAARSVFP